MHVAVIELLRCPAEHEDSALVASATRQTDRRIIEGLLGCPVCSADYLIHRAIADFRRADSDAAGSRSDAPNEDAAIRLAAQLDLSEPGRLLLLCGEYARLAPALSVVFDALCVAVNAPAHDEEHIAEHASVVRIAGRLPIALSSAHGAALDEEHLAKLGLPQVLERLRTKGRLLAPANAPLPRGVTLLARDASEWVGTREAETRGRILKYWS